jgi:hypothetical protein
MDSTLSKHLSNDTKNNSTVFCGLGHHFNGRKSNDSLFKVAITILLLFKVAIAITIITFQSPQYIYIQETTSIKIISVLAKKPIKKSAGKAHHMLKAMKVSRQFDIITCSQIFGQDAAGNTFIFSILLR